ncbi:hypothetical protein M5D96_009597, partial [Drosophila gunungcola]
KSMWQLIKYKSISRATYQFSLTEPVSDMRPPPAEKRPKACPVAYLPTFRHDSGYIRSTSSNNCHQQQGERMDWEMRVKWVGKWVDPSTGVVVSRNICLCNERVIIRNGTSSNAGSSSNSSNILMWSIMLPVCLSVCLTVCLQFPKAKLHWLPPK